MPPGAQSERFGAYQLTRYLTAGGMADLYLARGPASETDLVLKRIQTRWADKTRVVKMFLDEGRIAQTLDHPNIVKVVDVGCVLGANYIAMEYIPGADLIAIARRGVEAGRFLPRSTAVGLMAQVATGLAYAHSRRDANGKPLQIVHCDISPGNVVVSWRGTAKIVDFGIARATIALREEEESAGKYNYMAPEQIRGESVDYRADLFSLGVILYELTLGKRLFKGRPEVVRRKVLEGRIPRPRELSHDYPEVLEAILARLLARDPEQRYPSAAAVRNDLRAYLATEIGWSKREIARYLRDLFRAPRAESYDEEFGEVEEELQLERAMPALDDEEVEFDPDEAYDDETGAFSTAFARDPRPAPIEPATDEIEAIDAIEEVEGEAAGPGDDTGQRAPAPLTPEQTAAPDDDTGRRPPAARGSLPPPLPQSMITPVVTPPGLVGVAMGESGPTAVDDFDAPGAVTATQAAAPMPEPPPPAPGPPQPMITPLPPPPAIPRPPIGVGPPPGSPRPLSVPSPRPPSAPAAPPPARPPSTPAAASPAPPARPPSTTPGAPPVAGPVRAPGAELFAADRPPPAPVDAAALAASIAKALAEAVVPERTDETATVVDPRPRVRTPTGMRGLGDVPLGPSSVPVVAPLPYPLERAPAGEPPPAADVSAAIAIEPTREPPALHDDDTGPKHLVAAEPMVLRQSRSGEIVASATGRNWEPDAAPPPRTTPPSITRIEPQPPPARTPAVLVRLPEGRRQRSPAQDPTELVQSPPMRRRRRVSTGLVVGSCMIVVAGVVAALLILFR